MLIRGKKSDPIRPRYSWVYLGKASFREIVGNGPPLGERLPDTYKIKKDVEDEDEYEDDTTVLIGAIELHRLVLEDYSQLKRRAKEITEAIINATCSIRHGSKEVRDAVTIEA